MPCTMVISPIWAFMLELDDAKVIGSVVEGVT
jgi:hypothetical protein